MSHLLYKTGDKDAPEQIKDRNGEVVLGLCRLCGRAERELDESCIAGQIRFVGELNRVEFKPGDKFVLHCDNILSAENVSYIRHNIEKILQCDVIILGKGMKLGVLQTIPLDVAELVIAARKVAFEDQSTEALKELDRASEAFADRVKWKGERG